ncbi:MSH5 [Acanthosepion pharaonis]|uniref:MSH5 n=1 Tax=Acanthosepion pharaonis TaxID=158019 RepID=A0A812CEJ0_ACAPH|nr:MSH5 [Sepia pharaonis]
MTQVAKEELKNLDDDITECNVIYLPQLGYLVAIPKSDKMKTEEDFKIPGLEFVTWTEFLETLSVILQIMKRSLCTDFKTRFLSTAPYCLMLWNIQQNLIASWLLLNPPVNLVMSNQFLMKIMHPLQEIVCSPFVPNDTFSGGSNSKIKILTSPNASGKSVYLKQVALIVYMTCIGSFIPAESPSTICTVDRIFTRIKSQESVSVGLSTFMLDINQMSDALRNATSQSLVIVDEFGKGTETADGLALFASSLRYWIAMNERCPHVFVSTHFHCIIQYNLLPQSHIITYQTMETMHNGEELVFLFQLIPGFAKSSFANETALQAGLPLEIVKRGVEISKLIQENQPIHRVDTASTEQQLKRCHYLVNQFLEVNLEMADLLAFLNDVVKSSSKGCP